MTYGGNLKGRDAIKRDAKRGNCGGRHRVEGKDQNSLGEDARKHSLLGLNPDRTLGSCSVHMSSVIHLKSLND